MEFIIGKLGDKILLFMPFWNMLKLAEGIPKLLEIFDPRKDLVAAMILCIV